MSISNRIRMRKKAWQDQQCRLMAKTLGRKQNWERTDIFSLARHLCSFSHLSSWLAQFFQKLCCFSFMSDMRCILPCAEHYEIHGFEMVYFLIFRTLCGIFLNQIYLSNLPKLFGGQNFQNSFCKLKQSSIISKM